MTTVSLGNIPYAVAEFECAPPTPSDFVATAGRVVLGVLAVPHTDTESQIAVSPDNISSPRLIQALDSLAAPLAAPQSPLSRRLSSLVADAGAQRGCIHGHTRPHSSSTASAGSACSTAGSSLIDERGRVSRTPDGYVPNRTSPQLQRPSSGARSNLTPPGNSSPVSAAAPGLAGRHGAAAFCIATPHTMLIRQDSLAQLSGTRRWHSAMLRLIASGLPRTQEVRHGSKADAADWMPQRRSSRSGCGMASSGAPHGHGIGGITLTCARDSARMEPTRFSISPVPVGALLVHRATPELAIEWGVVMDAGGSPFETTPDTTLERKDAEEHCALWRQATACSPPVDCARFQDTLHTDAFRGYQDPQPPLLLQLRRRAELSPNMSLVC
ncbi:hypothetical protein BU16DRAFT_539626 [Lophium mytilinum]|uniref:Uncharacterized protein n=1 Tax=Lophium mytilinum TaxID=390894 RepID=A0A6A6QUA1_9PEZI|nr:hypothetical protein BU16DRAFT_539626 [Lophium mytilinum]